MAAGTDWLTGKQTVANCLVGGETGFELNGMKPGSGLNGMQSAGEGEEWS